MCLLKFSMRGIDSYCLFSCMLDARERLEARCIFLAVPASSSAEFHIRAVLRFHDQPYNRGGHAHLDGGV